MLANFGPDRAVWLRTRQRPARRRTNRRAGRTRQTAAHQVLCRLRPACASSSWCTRTARGRRKTRLALGARHIGRRGRAGAAAKRARLRRPHLRGDIIGRRRAGKAASGHRRHCATTRRGGSGRRDPSRRHHLGCGRGPTRRCPGRCRAQRRDRPRGLGSTRARRRSMPAHSRCAHASTSSPNSLGRNGFRRWPISPSAPTAARPVRIFAHCPRRECRRTGTRGY